MKLIIGQGNPESEYNNTRHNVGFFVLDAFAEKHNVNWQEKSKFKAEIAEITLNDEKILLVKPTTFYNETGESARILKDFYKLENEDILLVHDELALPFGTLRTRLGGSDAGNNGVKSLNLHLGTNTQRLRIGIWQERAESMDAADFVLSKFSSHEQAQLKKLQKNIFEQLENFVADSFKHHTVVLQTP
jgi:PTH1 family peptidyl-tRNA hydrolase